jgi:3-deoxy-D-manno-oct-2-ulosonic acid (Kdo) hydroxylase
MAAVVPAETISAGPEQEEQFERVLERGEVLLFARTPFALAEQDLGFLSSRNRADSRIHKNVAYRRVSDRLTGASGFSGVNREKLHEIMRRYCDTAVAWTAKTFPRYASNWSVDYASFRPIEEARRDLSPHARNDLLHCDAFPTRPTGGRRILRIFTNINPDRPRRWRTGETFEELAGRFAAPSGLLDRVRGGWINRLFRPLGRALRIGPLARCPYDEFMLAFHHFLKENQAYQQSARDRITDFSPGATWICFTDMVSHAVLSGQYALEQTFIVDRTAMVLPQKAPIAILERLAGRPMG